MSADATLEQLLLRTSRTFALSIPRLPEPLRAQVTVAYLLFRVADTLEDAFRWERARRLQALDDFAAVLRAGAEPQALVRAWQASPPCDHPGYLELLESLPRLLAAFEAIEPRAREAIAGHALRTTEGMRDFARGAALRGLEDLRAYCYVVAGIVGELLTELFVLHGGIEQAAPGLRARSGVFGEALQLVNVLRDAAEDADEGRVFLPAGVERAEVFALARADLEEARRYVEDLQTAGADGGVVAFCALPVLLAAATLDAVEREGAGAKVGREAVEAIVRALDRALERGLPAC